MFRTNKQKSGENTTSKKHTKKAPVLNMRAQIKTKTSQRIIYYYKLGNADTFNL